MPETPASAYRPDPGSGRERTGIRVEVRAGVEGVDGREWEALAEEARAPVFMLPGWIGAWWTAFGRGRLELVCAYRGDRLVGLLPVGRRIRALRSPTNWHTPLFQPLAEGEGVLATLVEAALASRPRSLALAFLDPDRVPVEVVERSAAAAGCGVLRRVLVRSPYLSLAGTFADYERSLSRNVRGDLRRCRRRLQELGRAQVEVVDGAHDLDRLLDEGFRLEAAGWKGRRRSAIVSRPETERFYRSMAAWAAARGFLRLAFLRLDGRAVAFLLDVEHGGAHYYLKGGYDPAFARLSPGRLLLRAMIERAFELGLDRFEFLGAEEEYKLQLASHVRELQLVQAFAPTFLGRVEHAAYARARPRVKQLLALLRGKAAAVG